MCLAGRLHAVQSRQAAAQSAIGAHRANYGTVINHPYAAYYTAITALARAVRPLSGCHEA